MDRRPPWRCAPASAPGHARETWRAAIRRRAGLALFLVPLACVAAASSGARDAPAPQAGKVSAPDSSTKFLYLHNPPSRWSTMPTFYYNHDGAPVGVDSGSAVQVIEGAIADWRAACELDIRFGGLTTARVDTNAIDYDNMGRDGVNVIGWMVTEDPFFSAEAGVFLGASDGSRNTIVEADVRLFSNSYGDWLAGPFRYLMLHELGHALGIGHSNESDVVMSGPPATLYTQRTKLEDDDIRACRTLYRFEAVEYHHRQYDHYFVTASPEEVRRLDDGTIAGWARTGHAFPVLPVGALGAAQTCRFWSSQRFAPKSSHFYATDPAECDVVRRNPDWLFEGEVFSLRQPGGSGQCGPGDMELYRSYNASRSGAPNHRYTTDFWIQSGMIDHGWIPEGYGPWGVVACVPRR